MTILRLLFLVSLFGLVSGCENACVTCACAHACVVCVVSHISVISLLSWVSLIGINLPYLLIVAFLLFRRYRRKTNNLTTTANNTNPYTGSVLLSHTPIVSISAPAAVSMTPSVAPVPGTGVTQFHCSELPPPEQVANESLARQRDELPLPPDEIYCQQETSY